MGALGGNCGGLTGGDACGGGGVIDMVGGSLVGVVVASGAGGGVNPIIFM